MEDRKRLEFSHSPSSRRPPTQLKLQLPLTKMIQMRLWWSDERKKGKLEYRMRTEMICDCSPSHQTHGQTKTAPKILHQNLEGSRHQMSRRVAPEGSCVLERWTLLVLPHAKRTVPCRKQTKVREHEQVQTRNRTELGTHHR